MHEGKLGLISDGGKLCSEEYVKNPDFRFDTGGGTIYSIIALKGKDGLKNGMSLSSLKSYQITLFSSAKKRT